MLLEAELLLLLTIVSLVLDLPKTKPIVECPAELAPVAARDVKGLKLLRFHLSRESELPEEAKEVLKGAKALVKEVVRLGYDNWNACEYSRLSDCDKSLTLTPPQRRSLGPAFLPQKARISLLHSQQQAI